MLHRRVEGHTTYDDPSVSPAQLFVSLTEWVYPQMHSTNKVTGRHMDSNFNVVSVPVRKALRTMEGSASALLGRLPRRLGLGPVARYHSCGY
jgi:hypothetical protein